MPPWRLFWQAQRRPLAFLLTPGQAADCKAGEHLLTGLPPRCIVHADRACGRDGAVIVSKDAAWRIAAPPVSAQSAVGAGDSFAAAITLAFGQGRSLEQALAFGVAAGTAAVLSPGAELCRSEDVGWLYASLRELALQT